MLLLLFIELLLVQTTLVAIAQLVYLIWLQVADPSCKLHVQVAATSRTDTDADIYWPHVAKGERGCCACLCLVLLPNTLSYCPKAKRQLN